MVKQAQILWSNTQGSPGGISVFHFDDSRAALSIRTTLRAMVSAIVGGMSDQWGAVEGSEVRQLDTATGQLTGIETIIPNAVTMGTILDEAVADSTCGLARYTTADFVNGRNVRGRTYIPGLSADGIIGGQWSAGRLTTIESFAAAFGADPGAVVYSRPAAGRAGSIHVVTGTSAWAQCAVLRHRRQR